MEFNNCSHASRYGMQPLRYGDTEKKIDKKSQCLGIWYVIIFEIANWKVQIENFIFPIFILQLFHTFFAARRPLTRSGVHGELLALPL